MHWKKWSFWALIVVFAIVSRDGFKLKRWNDTIHWDVVSYYAYLPAVFIHYDLTLKFIATDTSHTVLKNQFWPAKADNGGLVIKMAMGMSFLFLPFFLITHLIAPHFGYANDGFSTPYQLSIFIACLFYFLIGLIYFRKFLRLFFSETITAIAMICMVLGSNLDYYITTEPGMTHAYNFSLISIFLFYSFRWIKTKTLLLTAGLGLLLGLLILIRPINALVIFFPLLYDLSNSEDRVKTLKNWFSKVSILIVFAISLLAALIPQLIYWKVISGQWLFFSYVGERFYLTHPHFLDGLLSYRKGWLVYTPIGFLCLAGFIFLFLRYRKLFWPVLIFTFIYMWVIFSWWCWWYGGSFGMRALIDIYPLLALPLAALFQWALRKRWLFISAVVLAAILIRINSIMMSQYRTSALHWDSMTKEAYWFLFMKENLNDGEWKKLVTLYKAPDYDSAMKGEKEKNK